MNKRKVRIEFEMEVDDDTKEILGVSQAMTGSIIWLKCAWSVIGKNIIASIVKGFREHPEEFCEGCTERGLIEETKLQMATTMMILDTETVTETIESANMQSINQNTDNYNEWNKYYN